MKELTIDCPRIEKTLVSFISEEVGKAGFSRVVFGLSGGLDSAVSAYLAQKALGASHVMGVILPYSTTSKESLNDARLVADTLGIETQHIDITPFVDPYFALFPEADHIRKGNKIARERMTILYDLSRKHEALVLGTGNKSELLMGYFTIYGDGAYALNPLGDLYKTQVRQLARHLGVPARIIDKVPSAELWQGQTDEEELGFTYEELDRILYYLVDRQHTLERMVEMGFDRQSMEKVRRQIARNEFKRRLPLIARIST